MTAPAWTPLFTRAAAVVTDVGSAAAHASIIAREYGIPAVVGCGDATARLRTGMRVTVDGSTGNVEPGDRRHEQDRRRDHAADSRGHPPDGHPRHRRRRADTPHGLHPPHPGRRALHAQRDWLRGARRCDHRHRDGLASICAPLRLAASGRPGNVHPRHDRRLPCHGAPLQPGLGREGDRGRHPDPACGRHPSRVRVARRPGARCPASVGIGRGSRFIGSA